jgi:tetratricopeptide (TPR) repeat protein
MIVRNEEKFLAGALESVRGLVDEICIADSGSTDGTIAIAESFGAKIGRIVWRDDFAWARNQAIALASGAWIFMLDADERLTEDSRASLAALRTIRPDGRGRWIRCRNLSDAERGTVASTNAIIRIFPNDPAIRYRSPLHEYVARDGEPSSIAGIPAKIEIVHLGYTPEIMDERGKGQRNLRMAQAAVDATPGDAAVVYNYAMSALLAKERDLGREQLERVIAMTAGTPRGFRPMALVTLGSLYLEDGRFADALAIGDECVAIVPSLPDGHFLRGRALRTLNRLEEARAAHGEAIRTGTEKAHEHFVVDDEIAIWKAHNEIGGILVAEQRFAEALQWLDLALQARPAERTLILNRAKCLEALGDLAGALVGFRAVFDGFHDESAAIEYVNFVFRHGSPDIQLAAVEQALPMLGDDYRRAFLTSAAAAMLGAGRRPEATVLVQRVLEVGDEPRAGRAVVAALAQQFGQPGLNDMIGGEPDSPRVIGGLF